MTWQLNQVQTALTVPNQAAHRWKRLIKLRTMHVGQAHLWSAEISLLASWFERVVCLNHTPTMSKQYLAKRDRLS